MAKLEATPLEAGEETEAQLNIEINRTTLKADLLYKALYKYKHIILVIELQTGHDKDLQRRLMAYHLTFRLNEPARTSPDVLLRRKNGSSNSSTVVTMEQVEAIWAFCERRQNVEPS